MAAIRKSIKYFLKKHDNANLKKEKQRNKTIYKDVNVKATNLVRCMVEGRFDTDGTIGRYENGIVYCLSKYGDYIVGYYEEETPGVLIVRCQGDKEIIGYVSKDKITLSRQGQCDRFQKMGHLRHNNVMEWDCAERFSNCICDLKNTECVALCDEDNWEAGAAFICMQYESVTNTVFHDFWYSWL